MSEIDRLLRPPRYTEIDDEAPLVFLAGPIQGSPDWQTPTAHTLLGRHDDLLVATPRLDYKDESFDKRTQVRWELDHIWRASRLGAVAFWFAAQDLSMPYKEGRAYAQTTRVEIGAVSMLQKLDPETRVWVGFDPAYTSGGGGSQEYIELMREWFVPDDTIYDSLDDMTTAISGDLSAIEAERTE